MKIIRTKAGRLSFECPACNGRHELPEQSWEFNGDFDKPTLSPSVKVISGHYIDGDTTKCWCAYNARQDARGEKHAPFICSICHFYVRDGQIEFLADSTHELAGQTLELAEIKDSVSST